MQESISLFFFLFIRKNIALISPLQYNSNQKMRKGIKMEKKKIIGIVSAVVALVAIIGISLFFMLQG